MLEYYLLYWKKLFRALNHKVGSDFEKNFLDIPNWEYSSISISQKDDSEQWGIVKTEV